MKDGAADALMRGLAGGPRSSDALDNWGAFLTAEGAESASRRGAACSRIALKCVRSDGLARPYA